ncbi:MAG TPA: PEGA domain-containing protein [Polyangiales bacterium]|nr:PEGA domain-containing protein [Polyangiales bacterium]
MTRPSAVSCLVFVVALSVVSARGLAQSSTGAPTQDDARAAQSQHRAAVKAYARGKYQEAIALFSAADKQFPKAAFSFNVARAYDALADVSSALAYYREYLRRAENSPDAVEVNQRIRVLAAQLASRGVQQLTLLSSPRGAEVFVDRVRVGLSPITLDLTSGKHAVTMRLDGYQAISAEVELPPDLPRDVSFMLLAAPNPEASVQLPLVAAAAPGSALRTVGVVTLGAGLAALSVAITFEIMRAKTETRARRETEQTLFADQLDTMRSQQALARGFTGTGFALAAVGGVLFMVAKLASEGDAGERLTVAWQPSNQQTTVAGVF